MICESYDRNVLMFCATQYCRKSMKDDGVPPSLPIYTSGKFKGQVKGKGKGKDERMTIKIQSPKGEQAVMYAYGSETLESVRKRLPIDPELGPDIKRGVFVMKKIPPGLTLDILNIQDGDTLYVNACGFCCAEKMFRPGLPVIHEV